MARVLLNLALLIGVVPAAAAVSAITGLGVVRGLTAFHVGLAAALLTVLPITGLWSLFGRSRGGMAVAIYLWPGLLLLGLPGYFPGEVAGAIGTGLAVFAAPGGREATASAARFGQQLASPVDQAPVGEPLAPLAERAGTECLPSPIATAADQVALPYEGSGHSMAIPVQFGDVELPMLFDTGASVTTLGRDSLRQIGITVPPDAPEITLRTANGERSARLVIVPKVWVGGLLVEGVTIGICEECADSRTAGLLGLNVSSQFLVTVDTRRKEVVFQQRDGDGERLIDVAPWLKISAQATVWPDTRVEVAVTGDNLSPRVITEAEVGITCGEDHFVARLRDVPANGSGETTVRLPRGADCTRYSVSLDGAKW